MQAIHKPIGMGRIALATMACAAALFLLAPGGGTSTAAGDATASRTVTVSIKNFLYKPKNLTVSKGTTVVWSNSDSVKHTATRRGSFTTGKIKPGKAVAIRFTGKGTYGYLCSIHPEMRGKVIVD